MSSNNLRITRQRTDGRVVVLFRAGEYAHEALDLLGPGRAVFIAADGAYRVAVFTHKTHRLTRRALTPLCVATRAPHVPAAPYRREQAALPL